MAMRRSQPVSGAVLLRGGAPASSAPISLRNTRGSLGMTSFNPTGLGLPGGPTLNGGGGGGGGIGLDDLVGIGVDIGTDWIRDKLGLGNQPGGGQPGTGVSNLVPTTPAAQCPDGTFGALGKCFDLIPGGAMQGAGMVVDAGEAVIGAFNLPARVPGVAGVLANGEPIRRCPTRYVLGLDNLCYVKGTISRQFRKWPPTAKAPVSAHDAKMMRKYGRGGTKANAAKKLAMQAGFSCKQK